MMKKHIVTIFCLATTLVFYACYSEEKLNVSVTDTKDSNVTALDIYIEQNFTIPYGMAVRYNYIDRHVGTEQRITPPKIEVVRPMLDFIEHYWIDPYAEIENGMDFYKQHVPSEVILLGGLLYKNDGTVVLGTADAGARITFTYVNALDENNNEWKLLQLGTVYHEFAHTIHQLYKLPDGYEKFTPSGYTGSGSWFSLTDTQALIRGFVSPYATSNPNEDFAETVAFFLFDKDFYPKYIQQEENCTTQACELQNEGRTFIKQKLEAIVKHYDTSVKIDLEALRESIQKRL